MPRDRSCFYTVEGRYPFPLDMLRKDQSYPNDTESCNAITASIDPNSLTYGDLHKVNLSAATMPAGPEDKRWASFGWHVTDVNGDEPHMFYGRKAA